LGRPDAWRCVRGQSRLLRGHCLGLEEWQGEGKSRKAGECLRGIRTYRHRWGTFILEANTASSPCSTGFFRARPNQRSEEPHEGIEDLVMEA
jgi:hypothetical protein